MDSSNEVAPEISSDEAEYENESFIESDVVEEELGQHIAQKTPAFHASDDNNNDYEDEFEQEDVYSAEFETANAVPPAHSADNNSDYEDSFEVDNDSDPPSKHDKSLHVIPPKAAFVAQASKIDLVQKIASTLQLESDLEDDKASRSSLSLLLRKIESKYQDELEALREQNSVLTWRQRELKQQFRYLKEEADLRKSKLAKKRSRAGERRHEHKRAMERLQQTLEETGNRLKIEKEETQRLHDEEQSYTQRIDELSHQLRRMEERNFALAENLQNSLKDLHACNLKFEDAVNDKIFAEKRMEELRTEQHITLEVSKHKYELQIEELEKGLIKEAHERIAERENLPDIHQIVLDAKSHRLEEKEQEIDFKLRHAQEQMELQTAKQEQEICRVLERAKLAEDRADQKVRQEFEKVRLCALQTEDPMYLIVCNQITRERDSIDAQRQELLLSMVKTNARWDEERGKLEALRAQLEVKQLRVVEERAEIDAKSQILEERTVRLDNQTALLHERKRELLQLGKETYERSRVANHKMKQVTHNETELRRLRENEDKVHELSLECAKKQQELKVEKATLEKVALQLQQERLRIVKQRIESRYIFDGARKLDCFRTVARG
ncbi:unnamed protein product [Albugo candida]|uniref:Uncharacterized protein n=1 Tax=Albugo candida TaxID=65357 RepID=A0A024GE35_9STRA|nr:unnamed protein product [Albugo candida]|eukprot:CCI45141.1 unnamed protein product [Albugo candida]